MARIDFVWRKPEAVLAKTDAGAREAFIEPRDNPRNPLGTDAAIVHAEAVHPTH